MRRGLVLGAAAVALIAVMAAPGASPPSPSVPREVSEVTLACPEDLGGAQSSRAASLVIDPGLAAERDGGASARHLGSDATLATVDNAGAPVAVLSSGQSAPTTVVSAQDGFAPGLVAAVVGGEPAGQARGLDSATCVAPAAQWWFVGSGSDASRDATLLVSNPTAQAARFDIDLIGMTGPLEALGSHGLDLAAQDQARIRLSALVEGELVLSVQVTATTGRVAASLWDVAELHANEPQGVDFLAGSVAPRTDLMFAGIPSGEGGRELVLVNPGDALATASVQLVSATGSVQPDGLPQVVVPAGRVVTVDLARVLARAGGAIHLISDVPLTGAIRVSGTGKPRDMLWLAAADPTAADNPLAGAVLPAGPGLTSTVAVAAGDQPVSGTLTFLTSEPLPSGRSAAPSTVPASEVGSRTVAVSVPARSQLVVDVPPASRPEGSESALITVIWRAAAQSGPAYLAHTSTGSAGMTGYQWSPAVSTVLVDDVREDLGPLMGQ